MIRTINIAVCLSTLLLGACGDIYIGDFPKDWCPDNRVTGRSYMFPTSVFAIVVKHELRPTYRSAELQNALYEIAHENRLIPHFDSRYKRQLSYRPKDRGESCGPRVSFWQDENATCFVVKVSDQSGIWSVETLEFYAEMKATFEELRGVEVITYIEPDAKQNDIIGLDTGPLGKYDGKSLSPAKVREELGAVGN